MKQHLRLSLRLILTIAIVWALAMAALNSTRGASAFWIGLYAAIFVASGAWSIRIAFRPRLFTFLLLAEKTEDRLEPLHLFIAPFVFIFSFMLICHQIHLFDQQLFIVAQRNIQLPAPTEWTLFAFDQAARAVLLDAFETFYIQVSTITYKSVFWLGVLVFFFKTTLTIFFWRIIFSLYRKWHQVPVQSPAGAV